MGYNTRNTIDLHGMTREEALVIAKEALANRATSANRQLPSGLRF
jgi:DNA-nicking Smr family endonuclease